MIERHVELAERFPFMQRAENGWVKHTVVPRGRGPRAAAEGRREVTALRGDPTASLLSPKAWDFGSARTRRGRVRTGQKIFLAVRPRPGHAPAHDDPSGGAARVDGGADAGERAVVRPAWRAGRRLAAHARRAVGAGAACHYRALGGAEAHDGGMRPARAPRGRVGPGATRARAGMRAAARSDRSRGAERVDPDPGRCACGPQRGASVR
jgi:hypothetical protein